MAQTEKEIQFDPPTSAELIDCSRNRHQNIVNGLI